MDISIEPLINDTHQEKEGGLREETARTCSLQLILHDEKLQKETKMALSMHFTTARMTAARKQLYSMEITTQKKSSISEIIRFSTL